MAKKTTPSPASQAAGGQRDEQQEHGGGDPGLPVTGEHGSGAGQEPGARSQSLAPTLGLGDEQLSEDAHGDDADASDETPLPPQPAVRARQGDDGRPFCPTHNCLQVATGSKDQHTHYACPVPGCSTKEKRARPQVKVPAEPQRCPQRTCRDADGKPLAFLEVEPKLSSMAQLHMACPKCGFHMKVPRPIFAEALAQQRRPREDLAAR